MKSEQVKFVWSCTFYLGCFAGLVIQCREVCEMYFTYQTTSSIEFNDEDQMTLPALSICARYLDILKRDKNTTQEYGLFHSPPVAKEDFLQEASKLTIKNIFDLTPQPEDTINKCFRRSPDLTAMEELDPVTCIGSLNMTKYYTQEFICYNYQFRNWKNFSRSLIAHSLNYPHRIYQIYLTNVSNSQSFFVSAHTEVLLPLASRDFGKNIHRKGNIKTNQYFIYYRYNEVHLLPFPYQTNCLQEDGSHECVRRCLIERLRVFGRIPSSEMIDKPINLKNVNPLDMKDDRMAGIVNAANTFCYSKCTRPKCERSFCYTSVETFSKNRSDDVLTFALLVPESASSIIRTYPKVKLLDFIIYLCTSIGMWFGFTVSTLNPVPLAIFCSKFLKRKKQKSSIACRHSSRRRHRHLFLQSRNMAPVSY